MRIMNNAQIKQLNEQAMTDARVRIDSLAKPLGSLGRLEEFAVQLAGIRGYVGGTLAKKAVLVFAADNGIHSAEITPVPKQVTHSQTLNIANGMAGVSVFAKQAGAEVYVYDLGVEKPVTHNRVTDFRIMSGTQDMTIGPAMTRTQCEQAIQKGMEAVSRQCEFDIYGIGEMGICNTSTSAAVASVLVGKRPRDLVGFGAGISAFQYEKKIEAVERAIETNQPDERDPIDVIAKVGGLDIAAMTGAYLACAQAGTPVVIDGLISACAALCATRLEPLSKEYMFASHKSLEPGYMPVMQTIGLNPVFDLDMRLGEGSGCPFMFYILEATLRMIGDMGTFSQGNIDTKGYIDLRETR
jgi:nicotinate-nucleotide--dimethylbenzimidazole phosphoribosyltransferase